MGSVTDGAAVAGFGLLSVFAIVVTVVSGLLAAYAVFGPLVSILPPLSGFAWVIAGALSLFIGYVVGEVVGTVSVLILGAVLAIAAILRGLF